MHWGWTFHVPTRWLVSLRRYPFPMVSLSRLIAHFIPIRCRISSWHPMASKYRSSLGRLRPNGSSERLRSYTIRQVRPNISQLCFRRCWMAKCKGDILLGGFAHGISSDRSIWFFGVLCGQRTARSWLRGRWDRFGESLSDPQLRLIAERIGLKLDHPKLTLVGADLLDPASLEPLVAAKPERIYHTASLYDYSASLETLRRINVEGTRNLLRAIEGRYPKRFIHWSTCGVFGKPYTAKDGAKANVPFTEDSSSPKNTPRGAEGPNGTKLVNPYSISKWEQEKMIWEAHEDQGLPVTVVRPAPIYGPGSSYGHGGIVLTIAHGLLPAIPADSKTTLPQAFMWRTLHALLSMFRKTMKQSGRTTMWSITRSSPITISGLHRATHRAPLEEDSGT